MKFLRAIAACLLFSSSLVSASPESERCKLECSTTMLTCSNGCAPSSVGLPSDSCKQDCMKTYNSCVKDCPKGSPSDAATLNAALAAFAKT